MSGDPTTEEIERILGALITQDEVADLAGVGRDTPTAWVRRHADYPPVLAVITRTEMRSRPAVLAWLEQTGRLRVAPATKLPPQPEAQQTETPLVKRGRRAAQSPPQPEAD